MAGVGAGVAIGVGALASMYGSYQSSQSAGNAARSQQDAANRMRDDILGFSSSYRDRSNALSQASPQELATLGRSYDAASASLDRQQKLVDSIDPSIMEASKQALGLLQGQTANVNKPMMELRNSQRQSLLNSLRSQYGPGAENSSIGQKALQSFDMQSNNMFQQNQQNSLGQLFGMANTNTQIPMQQSIQGLQNVGAGYSGLTNRTLGAFENSAGATMNALSSSSQPVINSAGANYVGAGIQGQGLASLGGGMMSLGGSLYNANAYSNLANSFNGGGGYSTGMAQQNFSGSNQLAPQGSNYLGANYGG